MSVRSTRRSPGRTTAVQEGPGSVTARGWRALRGRLQGRRVLGGFDRAAAQHTTQTRAIILTASVRQELGRGLAELTCLRAPSSRSRHQPGRRRLQVPGGWDLLPRRFTHLTSKLVTVGRMPPVLPARAPPEAAG